MSVCIASNVGKQLTNFLAARNLEFADSNRINLQMPLNLIKAV